MPTTFSVTPVATLQLAVPNGGTFILPYAPGEDSSTAWDTTSPAHVLAIQGNIYTTGFSVSFDADGITVTNTSLGTIPASSRARLQASKIVLSASLEDLGVTEAGAALLDDADAAAQRATLGLGTAATTDATAYATAPVAAPAAANSTGTAGQIAYEDGFLYVCVATDTWQRVAIATWP